MKAYLALLLLCAGAASAHHGNFTYDGNTVMTLSGEVIAFHWTNPHAVVEIMSDEGRKIMIEVDGPSLIGPMGVTRASLPPGEHILAYVSPSNRGRTDEFLGREIIREDGSLVRVSVAYARQLGRENPAVTDSVLGNWVPDRRNLFAHVASSESWRLTPAGQASFDAYDALQPFAQTNCIAATAPTLMMYPTVKSLREVAGHIEIDADWMGATRTVYMDGRQHPDSGTRFYQGHSTGQWEGTTLVIDTGNFSDNPIGNVFSIASGAGKHLVERIALNADGSSATYSFTLSDPGFLAEPVSASYQWLFRPDVSVSSEACTLEAAGRYLDKQPAPAP